MDRTFFYLNKINKRAQWKYILPLLVYDIIAINAAYLLGLLLRFDFRYSMIPPEHLYAYYHFAPVYTLFCLLLFAGLKLYRSIWRYAGMEEMQRIISASAVSACFHTAAITLLFYRMPISYYLSGAIFQYLFITAIRFSYRFWITTSMRMSENAEKSDAIMVVGAGAAGQMIVKDLQRTSRPYGQVRCIIDDDRNKWNRYLEGIPIVGGRDDILNMVKKYEINKIFVAMPSVDPIQRRDILNICSETGCELKNIPGMYEIDNGVANVSSLKDVAIEDLLGRKPIEVDITEIYQSLAGKVILITGGGGSIGSELFRQISLHGVESIIIFDIYENNAYEIQQEIKLRYSNVKLYVEIGSVRDSRRVYQIFEKYRPDIVFHAAAHKHVPLMEDSPCEAIKNNAIGTYKTAYAAMIYGCQRFVLISTDKAVNPTNIMGASKRICEMIVQAFDQKIKEGRACDLPDMHIHADEDDGNWIESKSRYSGAGEQPDDGQNQNDVKQDQSEIEETQINKEHQSDVKQGLREIEEAQINKEHQSDVKQDRSEIEKAQISKEHQSDVKQDQSEIEKDQISKEHQSDVKQDRSDTVKLQINKGQDQGDQTKYRTEYVSVRFGNVLGSSGSVIPLFKKQIETTRIVTVTHPEIIRYFMTIPEAVSLVLQAAAYAEGGEIFVFDMGDPVKIDTLARNLIKLSGLRPDIDVKIEYTGLRAGEKLYEEKMMAEEGLKTTPNKLIHIGNPVPFNIDHFIEALNSLMQKAYENDPGIKAEVEKLVDTYKGGLSPQ